MIFYCLITKYITVGVLLYEIHDNPFTVFTCYTLIQREREKNQLCVYLPWRGRWASAGEERGRKEREVLLWADHFSSQMSLQWRRPHECAASAPGPGHWGTLVDHWPGKQDQNCCLIWSRIIDISDQRSDHSLTLCLSIFVSGRSLGAVMTFEDSRLHLNLNHYVNVNGLSGQYLRTPLGNNIWRQ